MLSAPLAEYQSIEQFVKDKTDREIGILGLTIIDRHIQECNDRTRKLTNLMKWVGAGVGIIVINTLATEFHMPGLKALITLFTGG